MSAPMHVLHPARLNVPAAKRIAFAPIAAREGLATELEQAIRVQSPTIRGDLQLLTAQDLMAASPVRLASTAPLTGDMTALLAARSAQAELLLMGEVVQDELGGAESDDKHPQTDIIQFGASGGPLIAPSNLQRPERMAVAWRVFDVASGQQVGSQTLAIDRMVADREYPDLEIAIPTPRERVIAASARQTWQAIAPYTSKEDAVIALPWFQPGASPNTARQRLCPHRSLGQGRRGVDHCCFAASMEQLCQTEPGYCSGGTRRLRGWQGDLGHARSAQIAQTASRDAGLDGRAPSLVSRSVGAASAGGRLGFPGTAARTSGSHSQHRPRS